MIESLLIAVHAFVSRVSMSFSVDMVQIDRLKIICIGFGYFKPLLRIDKWFGFFVLIAYQLFLGYLMPKLFS